MAGVVVEMTSQEARLFAGMQKIINQQTAMNEGFRGVGRGGQLAGETIVGSMQKIVGGLIGAGGLLGAVHLVNRAFADMKQLGIEAGQRIAAAADVRRTIFQLADPQQILKAAEALRGRGFEEVAAYKTAFIAASAGPEFLTPDALRVLQQAREIGFTPTAAIEAPQKLQAAWPAAGPLERGAGTQREILNQILAAAASSPVAAQDIASVLSAATSSWAAIGGKPEELLALGGVLSQVFKTPEATAERIKSLADQVARKIGEVKYRPLEGPALPGAPEQWRYGPLPQGLELLTTLPELAQAGRLRAGGKRVDLQGWITESLGQQALREILKQEPAITARLGEIVTAREETGTGRDLLARRAAAAGADVQLAAVTAAEIGRERREAGEEARPGVIAQLAQALRDELLADLRARGAGGIAMAHHRFVMGAESWFGDEYFLRRNYPAASAELQGRIEQVLGDLNATLRDLRGALDRQSGRNLSADPAGSWPIGHSQLW